MLHCESGQLQTDQHTNARSAACTIPLLLALYLSVPPHAPISKLCPHVLSVNCTHVLSFSTIAQLQTLQCELQGKLSEEVAKAATTMQEHDTALSELQAKLEATKAECNHTVVASDELLAALQVEMCELTSKLQKQMLQSEVSRSKQGAPATAIDDLVLQFAEHQADAAYERVRLGAVPEGTEHV